MTDINLALGRHPSSHFHLPHFCVTITRMGFLRSLSSGTSSSLSNQPPCPQANKTGLLLSRRNLEMALPNDAYSFSSPVPSSAQIQTWITELPQLPTSPVTDLYYEQSEGYHRSAWNKEKKVSIWKRVERRLSRGKDLRKDDRGREEGDEGEGKKNIDKCTEMWEERDGERDWERRDDGFPSLTLLRDIVKPLKSTSLSTS